MATLLFSFSLLRQAGPARYRAPRITPSLFRPRTKPVLTEKALGRHFLIPLFPPPPHLPRCHSPLFPLFTLPAASFPCEDGRFLGAHFLARWPRVRRWCRKMPGVLSFLFSRPSFSGCICLRHAFHFGLQADLSPLPFSSGPHRQVTDTAGPTT